MWSDLGREPAARGAIRAGAGDGFRVTTMLPLCLMMRAVTQKQGQRRAPAEERRTVAVQRLRGECS